MGKKYALLVCFICFVGTMTCYPQKKATFITSNYSDSDLRRIYDSLMTPLLLYNNAVFALHPDCFPRNLAGDSDDRNKAGDNNARNMAGDSDDRNKGGDKNDRNMAGDSDDRNKGGDKNDRNMAGDSDDRNKGGNKNDRNMAGDSDDRNKAGDKNSRNLAGDSDDRNKGGDKNDRNMAGDSDDRNKAGDKNSRNIAGDSDDRNKGGDSDDFLCAINNSNELIIFFKGGASQKNAIKVYYNYTYYNHKDNLFKIQIYER